MIVTFWESEVATGAFARDDISMAKYYDFEKPAVPSPVIASVTAALASWRQRFSELSSLYSALV